MNENVAGQEPMSPTPAESDCRLTELHEAIKAEMRPENCLGIVACRACNGIFDIQYERGETLRVENLVFVPCILGYSNNPEAHLDG